MHFFLKVFPANQISTLAALPVFETLLDTGVLGLGVFWFWGLGCKNPENRKEEGRIGN
jgi:hypothetical protein